VNYAKAVWEAFPDMTLELINVSEMVSGQVAHRWLLLRHKHYTTTANSKFWADPFIHFARQRGDPLQYITK